jgi:tripeptide aminopeptidase
MHTTNMHTTNMHTTNMHTTNMHTTNMHTPNANINMSDLLALLSVESESRRCDDMQHWIITWAESHGLHWDADEVGNIYLRHAEAPEAFALAVAHMDTVHDYTGDGIAVVRVGDRLTALNPRTMRQSGIGGDDKCGIYCVLHAVLCSPHVRGLLTVDEEIGGVGAHAADLDRLRGARLAVQADRRGNRDCVTSIGGTQIASDELRAAIRPLLAAHGFAECLSGGFTDVGVLAERGLGVSCLNLSAGYHHPHTASEYIDLTDLQRTLALMLDLLDLPEAYPHAPIRTSCWWDQPAPRISAPQPRPAAGRRRGSTEREWAVCWGCGMATVYAGEMCHACSPWGT